MKAYMRLILFFLLTPLFLANSCEGVKESENCHTKYTFINNSDKTIRLTTSVAYPDSTVLDGIGITSGITFPYEKKIFETRNSCIETDFELGLKYKNGVLMIFLFDEEIFKKYSFDEIRKNRMWLKKYDMRLEDFQRMNWTITYP